MMGNKEGVDGVVGGQRELHKTAYDRGMLDLRLQLIKMRTECVPSQKIGKHGYAMFAFFRSIKQILEVA